VTQRRGSLVDGLVLPPTEGERRSFWTTFSQQLLYRRGLNGELLFHFEKWKLASKTPTKEAEHLKRDAEEAEKIGDKGKSDAAPL
jgi:hypothetical protein